MRVPIRLYDQLPWQQGLKHFKPIEYDPIMITLWPTSMTTRIETVLDNPCKLPILILYDQLPWQQGLKHKMTLQLSRLESAFMTNFHDNKDWNFFLPRTLSRFPRLYDQLPWQQGLKPRWKHISQGFRRSLWPTSMTTRIETGKEKQTLYLSLPPLWPTSMTTRIET